MIDLAMGTSEPRPVLCPRSHSLQQRSLETLSQQAGGLAYRSGFRCDRCGTSSRHMPVAPGKGRRAIVSFHCDECGYDLCTQCVEEEQAAQRHDSSSSKSKGVGHENTRWQVEELIAQLSKEPTVEVVEKFSSNQQASFRCFRGRNLGLSSTWNMSDRESAGVAQPHEQDLPPSTGYAARLSTTVDRHGFTPSDVVALGAHPLLFEGVLVRLFQFAPVGRNPLKAMRIYSFVCREWERAASSDTVWQHWSQWRWPLTNPHARFKYGWLSFYKRRQTALDRAAQRQRATSETPVRFHPIENCWGGSFEARCPVLWENLEFASRASENVRICLACAAGEDSIEMSSAKVYYSETVEQMADHVNLGHRFCIGDAEDKFADGASKCCRRHVRKALA